MARGDTDFVDFATAASTRLQRAAYLLTGDRHQAEDAAQTALVRTYAAWSRVRRDDAFAYARRVLVNHLSDGWRRPLREYPTERMPDPASAVEDDPANRVAQRDWLLTALRRLSPRERTVVVLRHYFDLSEIDVASQLNVSVGTVKSTNARALTKLRVSTDHDNPVPRQRDGAGIGRGRP